MQKKQSKSKVAHKNLKKGKEKEKLNPVETISEGLNEVVAKKSFRYGLLIILGSVFIVMMILFTLGIKLNFLINDELSLTTTTKSYSIKTTNNEVSIINYTLKNNNFLQCNTFCEFHLVDLNNSELLYNYTKILDHEESTTETYEIRTPVKGEGQKIYNLKVSCNNIKSLLCTTNEDKKYKSSLITLNYELSREDKILKNDLLTKINGLKIILSDTKQLLDETNLIVNSLPAFEKLEKMSDLENISSEIVSAKNEIIEYEEIFKNEDYPILNDSLDFSLSQKIIILNSELKNLKNESLNLIDLRNNNSKIIMKLENLKPDLTKPISFYSLYQNDANNNELKKISKTITETKNTYQLIDFLTEKELNQRLKKSSIEFNKHIITFDNLINTSEKLILQGETLRLITNPVNDFCEVFYDVLEMNLTNHSDYENSLINFTSQKCENNTVYNYDFNDYFNSSFTVKKIELGNTIINQTQVEFLKDNEPVCCFKGECNTCYEEYNTNNNSYPILFIHGHIFNDANSPEYSLDTFVKMQQELEKYGYINAGELDLSETSTDWGRNGNSLTARASYYYISFYDIGDYSIISQKSERIENYALRLKEIIDAYKKRTGANKINIVAHSMGGLVSREYINLFGGEYVDNLILINTPNHGITGRISKACTILGSKKECEDMSENSIFLKRLNEEYDFKNTYSIRTIGCEMDEYTGDGVVTNQSGYLESAENYVLEGECEDVISDDLHNKVLNPEDFPETIEIIKEILE